MIRKLTLSLLLIGLAMPVCAQTKNELPKLAPLLPRDEEIAIAESAAPVSIAKISTVYVLEATGYVKVRDGSNGFTCLIERDQPLDFEPICYDSEGSETLVLAVLRRGELRREGKTEAEVDNDIAQGYLSGRFRAPRRPGVAYMLSPENRIYNANAGTTRALPPHVMLYAPYLKNSDFGFQRNGTNKLPFVVQEGQPDAFIIVDAPKTEESEKHQH